MKKLFLTLFLSFSAFFLASAFTQTTFAQTTGSCAGPNCYECKVAEIESDSSGQNWDVTYCVSAQSPQQLQQITQITTKCRKAPDFFVNDLLFDDQNCECHDDAVDSTNPLYFVFLQPVCGIADAVGVKESVLTQDYNNLSQNYSTILDEDGKYYTCFTLTSLSRNMGAIETQFKDGEGNILCQPGQTFVEPGNYEWFEYLNATLEDTIGIGIPGYTPPGEKGPKDLFCSTVEGKGTADNPLSFLTGIANPAINTALGCIATDPVGFTRDYLTLAIGIGGPIALILLLYAFFTIATAGGNPAKVQQGKEIISGVVQGLIVIILSVVLLGFLGINLLGLPGLV